MPKRKFSPPSFTGTIAVTAAAAMTFAAPAAARDEVTQVMEIGTVLSDPELASLRGKFVGQDSVSFFGISMLTSWQDAQGVTTNARLVFSVDFLNLGSDGNPVPSLMIGWVREGDPAMDVTDTHSGYVPVLGAQDVLTIGGIGTHQGAAQANVVTGAGNDARNAMRIAIVPASAMPQFAVAGLQSAEGSSDIGFADGDQLQFVMEGNRVGIVMTGGNGLDSSLQALGGDVGQLLQQTLLNTNGNAVFNNAAIVLATDSFTQSEAIGIENAISAMKGHGF